MELLTRRGEAIRVRDSDALFIDGVAVERLFDTIHAETRAGLAACGARLHFEVIAWEPLVAAGDAAALKRIFHSAVEQAAAGGARSVTLRAFSYLDDACVMFEILQEGGEAALDPSGQMVRLVRRMGGEIGSYSSDGRSGIQFWLPHWVAASAFPLAS